MLNFFSKMLIDLTRGSDHPERGGKLGATKVDRVAGATSEA